MSITLIHHSCSFSNLIPNESFQIWWFIPKKRTWLSKREYKFSIKPQWIFFGDKNWKITCNCINFYNISLWAKRCSSVGKIYFVVMWVQSWQHVGLNVFMKSKIRNRIYVWFIRSSIEKCFKFIKNKMQFVARNIIHLPNKWNHKAIINYN